MGGASLRTRLIALLVLAGALPLAVATLLDLRGTHAAQEAAGLRLLEACADALAGELDAFHRGYQHLAQRFARYPDLARLASGDTTAAPHVLEMFQVAVESDPHLRGLALFDDQGVIRYGTEPALIDRDYSFREYYRRARAGEPTISDIYLAVPEVESVPSIAYAHPVREGQRVVGVLAVYVRARAFWEAVERGNGRAGEGSFAVVHDRHAIRIAHSFAAAELFRPAAPLDPATIESLVSERRFGERTRALLDEVVPVPEEARRVRDASLSPVYASFSPANQARNLVVTRRLNQAPWTLFFQLPEATLRAPAAALVRETTTAALAILAGSLVLGLFAGSWVARPLRGLIAAAEALRRGEDARVAATGRGELGALERSWNALVEAVEADRAEQERRVAERTRDLDQARALLEAQNQELAAQNEHLARVQAREVAHARALAALAGEGTPAEALERGLSGLADELRVPLAVCWRVTAGDPPRLSPVGGRGAAGLPELPLAGAAADALRERRPVLLDPLPQEDLALRFDAALLHGPLRSAALLPLVAGDGATQGLLSVAAGGPLPPGTLELLQGLAQPLSLALSRATLREESDRAHADLQLVLDSAPVAMLLVDEGGVVRMVNTHALEVFGWSRQELLGGPVERLVPESAQAAHRSRVTAFFQDLEARPGHGREVTGRRRDGSEFPAEVALVPIHTAHGPCALAALTDISARVAARRELDLFFAVSVDLFTVVDAQGRFVRVNPAWERVLGYPAGALLGRRFMDLVHPADRSRTEEAMAALLQGQQVVGFENRYRAQDGRLCWLRWAAAPVLDLGLVFATARDVTEDHRGAEVMREQTLELRAQSEELRAHQLALEEKNKQLEQASRFKSEFLANMSHELRTPLNAVIGFSELLLSDEQQPLQPGQRKRVEDVLLSGRHLLGLINDILDLVKVESGRLTLNLEPVTVSEAVADALALIAPAAETKYIALDSSIRAGRPVLADRARLRQVLLNLLSNAVKFSPSGSRVEVLATELGGFVRFAIIDQGPGIDPALRARLFQPFVQGEGPLVKAERGTGLGLAISRRLVEAHGGSITVEPTEGGGSTFAFTIPECLPGQEPVQRQTEPVAVPGALGAVPRASSRVPVSTPRGLGRSRPVVLVVEDDPAARRLLEEWLSGEYELLHAADTRGALELAARVSPTLVLLDITLGAEDGLDLLVELKRRPALAAIPVIVTSGLDERQRGLALGASEWLVKPIDREVLTRRLRELLPSPPLVLVVDDDERVEGVLRGILEGEGYRVEGVRCGLDGLQRARAEGAERPGLIVIDLVLPDTTGLVVAEALASDERTVDIPRVVLTAADLGPEERERLRQHVHAIAEKGDLTREALLATLARTIGPRPSAARSSSSAQVLVVDDHDLNRELVRSILEASGWRVLEAEDGMRALELARSARPGLVLMDLAMPHMDGFTALRQLRADPATREIPVLALTALAMRSDERRAREAGFDGYLTKPVDRAVLEEAVQSFLGPGSRPA